MKIFFLYVFLTANFVLFGETLTLKESLQSAEPGSYVVTQQGKNYEFLYIRDKTETHIILEEAMVPANNFSRTHMSWRNWFEEGGPGHTLWTVAQVNVETGRFEEIYSFTHQGWCDLSEQENFLSTLLNLSFNELPHDQRKKVGLPPGRNKPDYRSLWNPKVTFEGRNLSGIEVKAYKARWPRDQSELSDREIEVYVPTNEAKCPTFFPYWVEVEGRIGNAKMRVIDSGHGVHSPRGSYPKKPRN